jgi:hypothetical protein
MRLSSRNWDLNQLAKPLGQPPLPRLGPKWCPQYDKDVKVRYVYGAFELCRDCASHRLRKRAEVGRFDPPMRRARLHRRKREPA